MDLIVYTNGTIRNVSGVTPDTTCAQLVYALAHATKQKGRFVLVATFSNSNCEHRFTSNEKPYQLIAECNKHGAIVTFELRRLSAANDLILDKNTENIYAQAGSEHPEVDGDFGMEDEKFSSISTGDGSYLSKNLQSDGLEDVDHRYSQPKHNNFPHQNHSPSTSQSSNKEEMTRKQEDTVGENNEGNEVFYNNSQLSFAHPQHNHQLDENPISMVSNTNAQRSPSTFPFLNAQMLNHQNSKSMLKKEFKRPPPPAYSEVIEQRCNSLTRNCSTNRNRQFQHSSSPQAPPIHESSDTSPPISAAFSTILNLTFSDLQNHKFTQDELEAFVDSQSRVIAAQKDSLLGLELTLSNDAERELVQLKKQHNNLQTVLNSLRNANWQMRVEAEQGEAEHLHTAIDAMKTAIENKRRELYQVQELQRSLELQLAFETGQAEGNFLPMENMAQDHINTSGNQNMGTAAIYS